MFADKRTYTNFDGVEVTETFYFNFTEAELAEMELVSGGLSTYIQKIIDAKDTEQIVRVLKDLLLKAVGEKSDDGRHFMKSPEISARFAATQAYSDMFMEYAFDDKKCSAFFDAVAPKPKSDSKVQSNK